MEKKALLCVLITAAASEYAGTKKIITNTTVADSVKKDTATGLCRGTYEKYKEVNMKFVFQYEVGDHVVYTGIGWEKPEDIERGETGTIVELFPTTVGVSWDKKGRGRHNCDGNCQWGHGWYVRRAEVRLI